MRVARRRKLRWWGILIGYVLGRAALVAGGVVAGGVVLAVVLWDADFFAARDRYELAKLAWSGPWPEINKFRSVRPGDLEGLRQGGSGVGLCLVRTENGFELRGMSDVQ